MKIMTNDSFSTAVVELAKLRADALAEDNTKKSMECALRLRDKYMHPLEEGCSETSCKISEINTQLQWFKAAFDPDMLKTATAIEAWGTDSNCQDEFTLFVLIGPQGYVAHRIIKGY